MSWSCKSTLESNGACDTLDAIIDTPNSGLTPNDKTRFLATIKATINSADNLFFLDEDLNGLVRLESFCGYGSAALSKNDPKPDASQVKNSQYVAINDYLTDSKVRGPSISMASKLDGLVKTMIQQAGAEALKNIKGCNSADDEKKLAEAQVHNTHKIFYLLITHAFQAKFTAPGVPSVTSSWQDVLDYIAKQGALSGGSCSNSQGSKRADCNRPSSTFSGRSSSTAASQKSGASKTHASVCIRMSPGIQPNP